MPIHALRGDACICEYPSRSPDTSVSDDLHLYIKPPDELAAIAAEAEKRIRAFELNDTGNRLGGKLVAPDITQECGTAIQLKPCRFFAYGRCMRGESCTFLHGHRAPGLDPGTSVSHAQVAYRREIHIMTDLNRTPGSTYIACPDRKLQVVCYSRGFRAYRSATRPESPLGRGNSQVGLRTSP